MSAQATKTPKSSKPAKVIYQNLRVPITVYKIGGTYSCHCGEQFKSKGTIEKHGAKHGPPDLRSNDDEGCIAVSDPQLAQPSNVNSNAVILVKDSDDDSDDRDSISEFDPIDRAVHLQKELITDDTLTSLGYLINTRGCFLICIPCEKPVLPKTASGHAYYQHTMVRFGASVLEPYIKRYKLWETSEAFAEATLSKDKLLIAYDGVKVEEDYYHCTRCVHASPTLDILKNHYRSEHRGKARPASYAQGAAQNIFLDPQYNRWIPVREKFFTEDALDIMEAWEDTYTQIPKDVVPVAYSTKEYPSWLKRLGWVKWLSDCDSVAMFEFLNSLKKHEYFSVLSDALVRYLDQAMDHLVSFPFQVRQILRAVTVVIKPTGFNPPESEDTIVRYANFLTTLVIAHGVLSSESEPNPPCKSLLHLEKQLPFVEGLFEAFSQDLSYDYVIPILHSVLMRLLVHKFDHTQCEPPQDPVFMFIVWHSRQRDGNFKKPNDVTQYLAATQFIARSTVVMEIFTHKSPDNCYYTQMDRIHPLMLQSASSPLGNVYGAWIILLGAARDEISLPNFIFTSEDNMEFVYHGAPGSVPGLRGIVHDCLDKADQILSEEVLFGVKFPILDKVSKILYDDTSNTQVNYSFLQDPRNKYPDPVREFIKTMVGQAWKGHRIHFGRRVNGKFVISAPNCLQWLHTCQAFLRYLLVSSHLTHGQPTRGSELMSTSYANSVNYPRSIFFINNEAVNALAINKTESRTGHRKVSPHWFSPRGSRQLFIYLLLVRPMEIWVAKKLREVILVTEPAMQDYSYFLFTGPQGRWDTVYFSNFLYKVTRTHLGVESGLKLSGLRQVLIAIYHKHCHAAYAESEAKSVSEEFEQDIGDAQANHSPKVARAHYGVQPSELSCISSVKMIGFRTVIYSLAVDISDRSLISQQYSRYVQKLWGVLTLDPSSEETSYTRSPSPPPRFQSDMNNINTEAIQAIMRHEAKTLREMFQMSIADMQKQLAACLQVSIVDSIADAANAMVKALKEGVPSTPNYYNNPQADLLNLLYSFDSTMGSFRSQEQAAVLDSVIKRDHHNLAILPTGEGKTLLWMLPAKTLWRDKVVIVVVPYVSLLADLRRRCRREGMNHFEWTTNSKDLSPDFGVVLVAVENAVEPDFYQYASKLRVLGLLQLIVVDECHSILTAAAYREGMTRLGRLLGIAVPLLFLTATLPPRLWSKFKSVLNLEYVSITHRPNHYTNTIIQVHVHEDARGRIASTVERADRWSPLLRKNGGLGLVICQTVGDCKDVANRLGVLPYFGGLDSEEKGRVFEKWAKGEEVIMVSTTASGTGVDLPNVRGVIHCGPPFDILTYAQNIGRLSRDGNLGISSIIVDDGQHLRVPEEDLAGVQALNSLIFDGKHCRKLPLSASVDGISISCLTNKVHCDTCEGKLGSRERIGYKSIRDLQDLPGLNSLKRNLEEDFPSSPSSLPHSNRPRLEDTSAFDFESTQAFPPSLSRDVHPTRSSQDVHLTRSSQDVHLTQSSQDIPQPLSRIPRSQDNVGRLQEVTGPSTPLPIASSLSRISIANLVSQPTPSTVVSNPLRAHAHAHALPLPQTFTSPTNPSTYPYPYPYPATVAPESTEPFEGPATISMCLRLQKRLTDEERQVDWDFRQLIWDVLDRLRKTCMLCWLTKDSLTYEHRAWECKNVESYITDQMQDQLKVVTIPKDKVDKWLCYGCFTAPKYLVSPTHGGPSKQDDCHFGHILRPLCWASWHLAYLRSDLVSHFNPRDGTGPQGSITEERDWERFFKWCFRSSNANPRFMNLFYVLLRHYERSAVFAHVIRH